MGNFFEDFIAGGHLQTAARTSDTEMLEPVTRLAVASIIAAAKAELGMDLMVFETFRSQLRQEQLFAKGVTELKHVGVHGYGLAADIVKLINGQPSWAGDFSFLGPLAKRFGLIWGGDWGEPLVKHSLYDADHVQRCSKADEEKLFAGTLYPDTNYSPLTGSSGIG